MCLSPLIKKWVAVVLFAFCLCLGSAFTYADDSLSVDRIQLATKQIELLNNRYAQAQRELTDLQKQHDLQISHIMLEKASKKLLDKASLDILVAKSNLDSVNIELSDAQQSINWLEKNIQEIENQLNVLGMFGLKVAHNEVVNISDYRTDLVNQQQLLTLEKKRVKLLQNLHSTTGSVLQLKKDNFNRLNIQLKSYRMLNIKQQQVKDELAFQELQNTWLQQLTVLYARINQIDPAKSQAAYMEAERDIFYANENANFAYAESLIARYKDQIQQMKLGVFKSNSISLLNEIGDQVLGLGKQITHLDNVLNSRLRLLEKHVSYLAQKKNGDAALQPYINKLIALEKNYKAASAKLTDLSVNLTQFRSTLDKALQVELSSRQGFPTFGFKMLLDLGKEMLFVPTLTYHVIKSLTSNLAKGLEATGWVGWALFAGAECALTFLFFFMRRVIHGAFARPAEWHKNINSKWLTLQWLHRNFVEFVVLGELIFVMYFFEVPLQNYLFIVYQLCVWLVFKSIMTISRVCLVEATHDTTGHDVKLYRRLKWIILVGGVISALTVFAHQLPLIYELKTLCDRLFLLFLMMVSALVLRSWHVVPHMILSHMEARHPYFEKSVRFVGFLVPVLIFGNAVIGLFGYVNLVMTVSGYEGVFLIVLIGYLTLRGLLTDGMEQVSRLMIRHVNNGWLWTEAFIKPMDKVLRIALFFIAWSVLFLLYGWDDESPIVERLYGLMYHKLINLGHTTITPIGIIELCVVISIFYWCAKWTREFVYRLLLSRTKDMGIRNSLAILSQYSVVALGGFISLRVLGIDSNALTVVVTAFAFGVGLGLRDLANNFACGFLILLERPLRVGDIVNINNIEGEVTHIGGRAVTVRTWDYMDLVVPNTEIFNKSFTNWTIKDNIVRSVVHVKIGRADNPHEVKMIIHTVLAEHQSVLKDPVTEVFLKQMDDTTMDFEIRYYVNIRLIKSRTSVVSDVLMSIWDAFEKHGIKPPYPQQEIFIRRGELASTIAS